MSTEAVQPGHPIAERPFLPDIAVADPAPLGLAAFALTTFVLSLANADVWKGEPTALALAAAYGGSVQLLAGMWEFKRNNTFGATAFSSYGGFWLSFFFFAMFFAKDATPEAVGAYLCGWTIFTAYMTVAALRVSGAVTLVFVLLTVTFAFLTIGAFNPPSGGGLSSWTKVGGWVGVGTAAAAWYASFAGVVNATFKRTVLPVFPLAV
jgi:succinate-acetate transporter protein